MEQNELKTNIDFSEKLREAIGAKAGAILTRLKEVLGHDADWSDMTDENIEKFSDHIRDVLKDNTALTYCSYLLIMLRANKELTKCENPEKYLYFKVDDVPKGLFLTTEHLNKIDAYEPKTDNEVFVKRLFMIMAYTGCSKNDALNLSIHNYIEPTNTIFYTTEKNRIDVSVPASNRALKYIKQEYKKELSNLPANTINRIVKRIANDSCIEGTFFYTDGTERRIADYMDLTTSRKTFATILYNDGYDPIEIQNMMGLLLRRNVLRYIVGYVRNRMRNKNRLFSLA